jgi:hypothetical protein
MHIAADRIALLAVKIAKSPKMIFVGAVSDGPIKEQVMTFGLRRRQKIIEVNGVRRLVDA